MQPWHRWREPLAVVLMVALALMLVIRGVSLVLSFSIGNGVGYGGIPGGDDLLVLSTATAVLWCTVPVPGPALGAVSDGEPTSAPSPHARPLAVAGLVVVGLSVLLWLVVSLATVAALVAWPSREVGFVLLAAEGVLRLVVPAAAVVAVVLALRRTRPVRRPTGLPKVTAAVPESACGDGCSGTTPRGLAGRRGDRGGVADRRRRRPGSARTVVVEPGSERRGGDRRAVGTGSDPGRASWSVRVSGPSSCPGPGAVRVPDSRGGGPG